MRKDIEKKQAKLQTRIDAYIASAEAKIAPLKEQIEKYDAVLAVLGEQGL